MYTVELERELDAHEDGPGAIAITDARSTAGTVEEAPGKDVSRRVSLDPEVLAGIVANLRAALDKSEEERDSLVERLGQAHSLEAELKEALAIITEKHTEAEKELTTLRKKNQDDEETIVVLRSKVEESRFVTPLLCWIPTLMSVPGEGSCVSRAKAKE